MCAYCIDSKVLSYVYYGQNILGYDIDKANMPFYRVCE